MGWESRDGRGRYYTHSRKEGGRVVREYYGTGTLGEVAASVDAQIRQERLALTRARQQLRDRLDAADALAASADALAGLLARACLLAAGYHRHDRGRWRRRKD